MGVVRDRLGHLEDQFFSTVFFGNGLLFLAMTFASASLPGGTPDALELGPVAETVSMYEAVQSIRPMPLGKQSLVAVVAPAVLPMIPVMAIEVPLKDTLLKLLGVLI
jgi:hypothetical protein